MICAKVDDVQVRAIQRGNVKAFILIAEFKALKVCAAVKVHRRNMRLTRHRGVNIRYRCSGQIENAAEAGAKIPNRGSAQNASHCIGVKVKPTDDTVLNADTGTFRKVADSVASVHPARIIRMIEVMPSVTCRLGKKSLQLFRINGAQLRIRRRKVRENAGEKHNCTYRRREQMLKSLFHGFLPSDFKNIPTEPNLMRNAIKFLYSCILYHLFGRVCNS